nr:protease complex subunit PrcB family protein [Treponema denticola]
MKKCLSLSILILLLLGACKTDISKKSSNQDYEIISAGSAKEYYFSEIIRNQEDFNNFYRLIFGNKKAPVIDFSKQTVIAAFGGSFNTGGYSINVRSIFKKSNKINVNFCMSYPKKIKW